VVGALRVYHCTVVRSTEDSRLSWADVVVALCRRGGDCVVGALRVYQQLLQVELHHRGDLLDTVYYANVKVRRLTHTSARLNFFSHCSPS